MTLWTSLHNRQQSRQQFIALSTDTDFQRKSETKPYIPSEAFPSDRTLRRHGQIADFGQPELQKRGLHDVAMLRSVCMQLAS